MALRKMSEMDKGEEETLLRSQSLCSEEGVSHGGVIMCFKSEIDVWSSFRFWHTAKTLGIS